MPDTANRLLYIDAVRALPEPIFVVSSDGLLLDANGAALRLIGVGEIVRDTGFAAVVTDPPERVKENLRLWSKSLDAVPGRLTFKSRGTPVELGLKAWCARAASAGRPALLIIRGRSREHSASRFIALNAKLETLTRDVLARQRVEAELTDALKARDDLVAVAAHELRNPLNVFHLTLQLLYRLSTDGASAVDLRRILDRSRIQLSRISALVDRLLDVTRLRSGKFELDRELVELDELAREVVVRLREEYPTANLSLETDAALSGNWDRLRLDQAITNITTNAIKYGRGQPITVRISKLDDHAIITVRDQGVGMSSADLERIFDRFERAAPRANNEGLGLGLWITKRIAEAHDGSVRVESELGKGSIFTLRLPL